MCVSGIQASFIQQQQEASAEMAKDMVEGLAAGTKEDPPGKNDSVSLSEEARSGHPQGKASSKH